MSVSPFRGWRGLVLALCAAVVMLSPASGPTAQSTAVSLAGPASVVPNFDLGARWTSAKVGKLVFDTSVTPHWMQTGDRFWYSYQTREGRRFYMVDPFKKAKAPLFDHAKMAAALTSITRQPYDAQHLPFSNIKFKNDNVFELRHAYADAGPYINQRRADYFCRYLLGNTEESVDIVELNREQQQTGGRGRSGS